jgi:hypothetical protein
MLIGCLSVTRGRLMGWTFSVEAIEDVWLRGGDKFRQFRLGLRHWLWSF